MPRLVCLDDIMFPVDERPVFVDVSTSYGDEVQLVEMPNRKAIVDVKNHRVLGIVGRDYRLVTNAQALAWAFECCQMFFPKPSRWNGGSAASSPP